MRPPHDMEGSQADVMRILEVLVVVAAVDNVVVLYVWMH